MLIDLIYVQELETFAWLPCLSLALVFKMQYLAYPAAYFVTGENPLLWNYYINQMLLQKCGCSSRIWMELSQAEWFQEQVCPYRKTPAETLNIRWVFTVGRSMAVLQNGQVFCPSNSHQWCQKVHPTPALPTWENFCQHSHQGYFKMKNIASVISFSQGL